MKHIKMFRAALAALVAVVLTSQSLAADIFVSPTGNGEKTGANWSNALNGSNDGWHIDVKNAITSAVDGGAEEVNVYLAAGDYTVTNQLALSSITIPVMFSGGYVGATDGSLEKGETKTTFARTQNYVRHIYVSAMADFLVDSIVFENGLLANTGAQRGGSLYLNNSSTVITNCTFTSNRANSKSNTSTYGGAVYAPNGALAIFDSTFTGNRTTGSNCTEYGGAVCAQNADLTVDGCKFIGNYSESSQSPIVGGAISANGKTVTIRNSIFSGNCVYGSQNKGSSFAVGGSVAVRNALRFEMSDCILENNYASLGKASALKCGFYLDDCYGQDGVMTSVVTRCVFSSAAISVIDRDHTSTKSDILLNGGCLFMTNCVIVGASGTDATMTNSIRVARLASAKFTDLVKSTYTPITTSEMELVNVTISDGKGVGAVAIGEDTNLSLKNCIVYGNGEAGVINATSIDHCCLQEEHEGEGNFVPESEEALNWTGAPYYHLLTKKANGAITNGWFSGTFESAKTTADSPCIDAGAPGSVGLDLEPYYSGRRVNIGAYGGTPWASKTSPLPGFKLIVR